MSRVYRKIDETVDKSNASSVKQQWKEELSIARKLVNEILEPSVRESVMFILERDAYTKQDILALRSIFKNCNRIG